MPAYQKFFYVGSFTKHQICFLISKAITIKGQNKNHLIYDLLPLFLCISIQRIEKRTNNNIKKSDGRRELLLWHVTNQINGNGTQICHHAEFLFELLTLLFFTVVQTMGRERLLVERKLERFLLVLFLGCLLRPTRSGRVIIEGHRTDIAKRP